MVLKKEKMLDYVLYSFGAITYIVSLIIDTQGVLRFLLFLISYLAFGFEVIYDGIKKAINGDVFSENTLMTVATLGAFVIKEYPEAVAVMLFYNIGEYLQDRAVDNSRESINALLDIRPDTVNLIENDVTETVSAENIEIGQMFLVKPGERIALDGIVEEGVSSIDASALTGESLPRDISIGSEVYAGSINVGGAIKIKATKLFSESFASKIIEMVENSNSHKAKTDRFITRFSHIYTPIVVLLAALLTFIPTIIYGFDAFGIWLKRSLIFLVISCPCALVVSVPLSLFVGIGRASKRGILFKGSLAVEKLAQTLNFAFDKTGTLTRGVFEVTGIYANGISEKELLDFAAHAEINSTHPIAKSIVSANNGAEHFKVSSVQEIAGFGVSAVVDGKKVSVGNKKLISGLGMAEYDDKTGVYVLVDGEYKGFIEIADKAKENAAETIKDIKQLGAKNVVMLTGDEKYAADKISKELDIESFSKLLPQEKVEKVKELKGSGNIVFVGDGINDAPVLTEADIGVAMGAIGSDAAIEAADVVILDDDLSKIPEAIRLSRKTLGRAKQNIALALSIKVLILALGAIGLANMWLAVVADVGVTLLAVGNSIRK